MDERERLEARKHWLTSPEARLAHKELCRRDILHWFDVFAWTFDPRTKLGAVPFELYEFQKDAILEIKAAIEGGHDLLVEKSRDMGVSWLILLTFQWFWQFRPASNFHLGSRKQAYVDELGNISTLFEKIRFNLRWQPKWLKPVGYDERKHGVQLRLINPELENIITGEAPGAQFSRAGRYSAILYDEFPFWPLDETSWAAGRDSSPCRMAVGTPYGKNNRFAKMALRKIADQPQKLTLHWSSHPLKDAAWYEAQKLRATPSEIARELDINYDLSVEGVVFPEFNRRYHCEDKEYRFNPEWQTVVAFDFGVTCGYLIAQIDPDDRLHVFRERVLEDSAADVMGDAYLKDAAKLGINGKKVSYTCDPAGKKRSEAQVDAPVAHKVLESLGIRPLRYDKAQRMPDRLDDGIEMLRRMFALRRNGQDQIVIYEPGCPLLLEALESEYKYKRTANDERLDIIDKKHPYSEVVDCLRYLVIEHYGVDTQPAQTESYQSPYGAYEY